MAAPHCGQEDASYGVLIRLGAATLACALALTTQACNRVPDHAAATGTAATRETASLEQFLVDPPAQGIAYRRALAYGPEAVPVLQAVLRDASRREQWPVAVTVLAMLGTPEAVATVIRFVHEQGITETVRASERGLGNAVFSLGYAANAGRSVRAHAFLLEVAGAVLEGQDSTADSCAVGNGYSTQECGRLLEQAIYGLALAATAASGTLLTQISKGQLTAKRFQTAAQQALLERQRVVAMGLAAYDDARWD